jgi:cytidyltransferase-like protein
MKVVAVSGGYDPIHPGHIRNIEEALTLGDRLLVILSRDEQLVQKKGYCALPYYVRKYLLDWGLQGRGEVVENIDADITCKESLLYYRPNIFAKGGDSWDLENLPERWVCEQLGIQVIFGVGGYDKPFSSSRLLSADSVTSSKE